jgi:hypothetical protein
MYELVEDENGKIVVILKSDNDNDAPFDPHAVNGYDDGDPHMLSAA